MRGSRMRKSRVQMRWAAAELDQPVRGEDAALDLMPGTVSAAEKRAAELFELAETKRENAELRGQVDALRGELESLRRAQADHYAAGKRDGERLRGLPSILGR